jgi:alginate O-acetyltransferase complex protein AlgI
VIFATYWFLAFAAVFFPLFWLLRNAKARFGLLIGASAVFHTHYAGPAGVIPIIALGVAVYFLGLSSKKIANTIGIIACVAVLLTYKYSVFLITSFVSNIHAGLGAFLAEAAQKTLPAVPPLAVSFFVFEFVHYLVDRRRGTEPIRNPLDFAVFSIFFPTLVAGPIKRYEQFLPSVHKALREVCSRDVMAGMVQMCLGFLKKLIADNLTLWIEASHYSYADMSPAGRWAFFAAIGFRILLDFSGYSDIAIGLARMMGISIPPNFNWPYLSTNIRDFWHRWHISLSSWIRDYVYIPLGGNRHGNFRRFLNGLVAFSLCGLWHGPAWNFVLWGLYHGLGLSISNAYRQIPFGIGTWLERTFHRVPLLGWAVTLLFVWLGWLLFFYPAPEAWKMAKLLFVF